MPPKKTEEKKRKAENKEIAPLKKVKQTDVKKSMDEKKPAQFEIEKL